MKIIHVITSLNNAGAQAILYRLVTNSRSIDHSVISLTDMGKYGPLLQNLGINVYPLGLTRGKLQVTGLWKAYKIIRSQNPDLVQTWLYHADLVGSIAGVLARVQSIVWGVHNSNLSRNDSSWLTRLVVKLLARISKSIPSTIICCSRRALELHVDAGYDKTKFHYIANGVDLNKYVRLNQVRSLFDWGDVRNTNRVVIGMVGRWSLQKDHKNLITACRLLLVGGVSNFKCVFVGPGMCDANQELKQVIFNEELENHVYLAGERNDIPEIMNEFDVHVLSSAFGEAFPNVVAEAMSCGVPCVVTDVGDAGVMVGDTGWVVPARSPEDLTSCLKRVISLVKKSGWSDRVLKCRARAEKHFDSITMINEYSTTWRNSIDKKLDKLP